MKRHSDVSTHPPAKKQKVQNNPFFDSLARITSVVDSAEFDAETDKVSELMSVVTKEMKVLKGAHDEEYNDLLRRYDGLMKEKEKFVLAAEEAEIKAKAMLEERAAVDEGLRQLEREEEEISKLLDGAANDIIELNVSGTHITVQRATLCAVESKLSVMFSGRWDDNHTRDKGGRIFLDFNPKRFQVLVDMLRDYRMEPFTTDISMPDPSFAAMWKYLAIPIPVNAHFSASKILTAKLDEALFAMVAKHVEKDGEMQLLYSADGNVDGNEFHRLCDGKGKTVTLVRCIHGYIFGGFNPKSWKWRGLSHEKANGLDYFLFSLKNPEGLPPKKYPVLRDDEL